MKTIIGFALGFVALAALAALPVYPQPVRDGAAHTSVGSEHSSSVSSHGDSAYANTDK